MDIINYALKMGSNVYINNEYNISYSVDGIGENKTNLFTLKNTRKGPILTTVIRDEYADELVKIDKNKIGSVRSDLIAEGSIKNKNGFILRNKITNDIIIHVNTTEDGFITVEGTLYVGVMRLKISPDSINIENIKTGETKNLEIYNNKLNGKKDILITDEGVRIGTNTCGEDKTIKRKRY